ncbi:MAG: thiol:disulfide interchange protein DsbA/DsbL [Burkholderiaceae bacterium]|nr:thiol:disulfide interchange protein DsbA/DsbL [Burkholderiaceae bacterium]
MPIFNSRRDVLVGLCCAALVPLRARAQEDWTPVAGTDYVVLQNPQPVETGDRIEVTEFFQYSCPHCFAFTPDLEVWRRRLAADVAYVRVPVAFDPSRQPHSLIYYSLQALNRLDLHDKIFTAFHLDHRHLLETDEIADFMAQNGIDRTKWLQTYNSFSVVSQANRAVQIYTAYKIDGTPTLACEGRYETSPAMAHGSHTTCLLVMDFLIDKVRRERKK